MFKPIGTATSKKLKTVLASVVALEGSSYRRPGVRMLIREDGKRVGAVSGGCVEKEVFVQSQSVFADDLPKVMVYDGRYRLGCEGILYILIEPFQPEIKFFEVFEEVLKKRITLKIISHYEMQQGANAAYGSVFVLDTQEIPARPNFKNILKTEIFEQNMNPCFKLVIIGAEHDAVQLCLFASLTGWEVTIIAAASEEKEINNFPGAHDFKALEPELFPVDDIDDQTAVVIMTHSYVRDLQYLLALKDANPNYVGILGPAQRRERLLGDLMERHPEISDTFIDTIHGPAGINIGAETAQEIAMAIIAEILSVTRNQKPMMLKNKSGSIHS